MPDDNTSCIATYSANRVSQGIRGKRRIVIDNCYDRPTVATNNFNIAMVGKRQSMTANSLYCLTKEGMKYKINHRENDDKMGT